MGQKAQKSGGNQTPSLKHLEIWTKSAGFFRTRTYETIKSGAKMKLFNAGMIHFDRMWKLSFLYLMVFH